MPTLKSVPYVSDEEFIKAMESLHKNAQRLGKTAEFKRIFSKVREIIIKKQPNSLLISALQKFI